MDFSYFEKKNSKKVKTTNRKNLVCLGNDDTLNLQSFVTFWNGQSTL